MIVLPDFVKFWITKP